MRLYGTAEIGRREDVSQREGWRRALLSGVGLPLRRRLLVMLVDLPDTGVSRCSRHHLSPFKLVEGEDVVVL